MRAALTCALMSWGCSGGEGRKNKASAQQTDSSPVPHAPCSPGTWCHAALQSCAEKTPSFSPGCCPETRALTPTRLGNQDTSSTTQTWGC